MNPSRKVRLWFRLNPDPPRRKLDYWLSNLKYLIILGQCCNLGVKIDLFWQSKHRRGGTCHFIWLKFLSLYLAFALEAFWMSASIDCRHHNQSLIPAPTARNAANSLLPTTTFPCSAICGSKGAVVTAEWRLDYAIQQLNYWAVCLLWRLFLNLVWASKR